MLTGKKSKLLLAVLKHGSGTHFAKEASKIRDVGHTIFLGHGTAHQGWMQFLCVDEIKKEIVLMLVPEEDVDSICGMARKVFHMEKKNTGILLSLDVSYPYILPENREEKTANKAAPKEVTVAYKAIFTVVEQGKGEDVMDVAEKAGARGGTIIHARGAGAHEHQMLFNIQVEPEKDIVMIIAPTDLANDIVRAIREDCQIEEPGNGILFVLNADRVLGIVE